MRRLQTLSLVMASALAACSPEPEPAKPSLSFRTDGATYVWSIPDSQTPALVLGAAGGSGAAPALALSCSDAATGGLRVGALIAEPVPVPLELKAGPAVFIVTPRRVVTDAAVSLEGEGALPQGWFEALAAAEQLRLQYGDQGLALRGPGEALAREWADLCRQRP